MLRILVINSSVSGAYSVSRGLVQAVVDRLARVHPQISVIARDVGVNPLPHLTPQSVAGIRDEPVTPDEHQARALSDELIGELLTADVIVIGAPMYNFSIPSTLKAWFDHVVRPGVTFTYEGGAPKGLIEGKRVILVESRGGRYADGPMQPLDFHDPYLQRLLAFIGLSDLEVIRAEGVALGVEPRAQAIAEARRAIDALTGDPTASAA